VENFGGASTFQNPSSVYSATALPAGVHAEILNVRMICNMKAVICVESSIYAYNNNKKLYHQISKSLINFLVNFIDPHHTQIV
jgi:hypothetical protein